jgi:hypothetical protein
MQTLCRKKVHDGGFCRNWACGCARCALILLCILCAGCSPRPGASFGFTDGKPIYVIRENTKEECLRTAERRCQSAFIVLEEGPVANPRGGWVDPERHTLERGYSVRVKCDSH